MERLSDLRRHGLFNAKVPRFTSYPPANRFSPAVGADVMSEWLNATPEGAALSLYVHIPFCRRLCYFCACRTQGTKTDKPLAQYVERVLEEAAMVRSRLPATVNVRRLHLGGGTPTILPVALMHELLDGLAGLFGFSEMEEISVEVDPTEVDRERLETLAAHGLNRASLGVQDFEKRVQEAIGRPQSVAQTVEAATMLRDLGIEALNVDLLYGLPFQTRDSLRRTLDRVSEIGPSRVALYGYAHVPWMSKRQSVIPSDALPAPEERYALFELARKRFLGQGYLQVGIDHFARPEDALAQALLNRRLARSFQGYTDDRVPRLIGLGASSISHFPEGYLQNIPATALYQARVAEGALATARGCAMTPESAARAEMIEQLMCYFEIRLGDLRHRIDHAEHWLRCLAADYPDAVDLTEDGLVIRTWARPLVRIMAARLGHEHSQENTFSAAI